MRARTPDIIVNALAAQQAGQNSTVPPASAYGIVLLFMTIRHTKYEVMQMKQAIRLTALVLTLALLLTLCPLTLWAQDFPTREGAVRGREKISGEYPATGAAMVDYAEHNMLAATYASGAPYGYVGTADTGGTPGMAAAYFARWGGAVDEARHPYPSSVAGVKYMGELSLSALITDIVMIPHTDEDNSDDIVKIKRAVSQYGAAYLSMQYVSSFMNSATASYYMPESYTLNANYGHAVTVVGWDDSYSKSRFNSGTQPQNDGAFIIKNSYGTSGGGAGYFYLSYEDKCLGRSYLVDGGKNSPTTAVYIAGASVNEFDYNHQHDPYGHTSSIGLSSSVPYYYMANAFTANVNQTITAASFYTLTENVQYEVYVVTGTTSALTLPAVTALSNPSASGTQGFAGYHTVRLDHGVAVSAGQRFAVVVKIANTASYPVAIEKRISNHKSFSAQAGQSYVSSGGTWQDTAVQYTANLCVKAFGVSGLATGTVGQEQEAEYSADEPGALVISDEGVIGEQGAEPYDIAPYNAYDIEPGTGSSAQTEDGFIPGAQLEQYTLYYESDVEPDEPPTGSGELSTQFDLRDAGVITPVKNQGAIGSCWTFAATASAESTWLLNSGQFTAEVELGQSSLFMPVGGSMTLTATAVQPDLVQGVAWQITGGDTQVSISPNGDECIVTHSSQTEGITEITCTVTYQDGQTAQDVITLVAAGYGGNGTQGSPYTVSTPKQLALLHYFAGSVSNGVYFAQTRDIDLSGISSWTPIGTYYTGGAFEGNYDGRGYAVLNMTIRSTQTITENTGLGLFNCIEYGSVKNLAVANASIVVNARQGYDNYIIGLLAARVDGTSANRAEIQNCVATGSISVTLTGSGDAYSYVGGLCGAMGYTNVTSSSFTGSITHTGGKWNETGGLCDLFESGAIQRCFANSTMRSSGQSTTGGNVSSMGGLVYELSSSVVSDCYAISNITAVNPPNESEGAGLVVFSKEGSSLVRCYTSAKISGIRKISDAFVAYCNEGTNVQGCYYDRTLAAQYALRAEMLEGGVLEGLTQTAMNNQNSFSGWDFTNTWAAIPLQNGGLPIHKNPPVMAVGMDVTVPNTVYLPQSVPVALAFTPAYASPQQVWMTITNNGHLTLSNGVLTAVGKGLETITLTHPAIGETVKTIRVDQRRGDLTGNGAVDTVQAITLLINLFTGKTATYSDYYLLDVNRSAGDAFTASREDITLTDLVQLKQFQGGAREINP